MKPTDVLNASSKLGIAPSKELLVWLAIALPLLVAGAAYLRKYWKARAKKRSASGPASTFSASIHPGPAASVALRQLRRAWLRFLRRLPRRYRRSILNFDHFIVFGMAASGKTRLVDAQTNFRYQMKQVAGDAPVDPELPVFLASGAVITEVPALYLEDQDSAHTRALERLFRPLYRNKTPTVVLALDVVWLMQSPRDTLLDLARALRIKVNLLSEIRRRPIEVRIALTRLDTLAGFHELAWFWSRAGISARIALAAQGPVRASLSEWEQELNAQLPRALSLVRSEEYRRVIAFSRRTSSILAPLEFFLDALFADDVVSERPTRGGVYLCSDVPETANPLRNAADDGPPPNPLRRHLIAAAAAAAFSVLYMGIAYRAQDLVWAPAADAAAGYEVSPELVGSERESSQRQSMLEFTTEHQGLLYVFPGFFASLREKVRDFVSAKLRDELLLPRLRDVAEHGILGPDQMTLRWRRTVYYLGLIHSYRADALHIKSNLGVWEEMTGLPKDVIYDYLENTRVPYREPVHFKLGYAENDERDSAAYWRKLPVAVLKAMVDGELRPEELSALQTLAQEMTRSLSRFEHDDLTLDVLKNIDAAADTGGERRGVPAPKLHDAYAKMFDGVAHGIEAAALQQEVGELRRLISLVLASSVDEQATTELGDLVDRLTLLEAPDASAAGGEPVRLDLAGEAFAIDPVKWRELVRSGRATTLIDRFVAGTARADSIFFSAEMDAELRQVVWNPLGNDASIFRGSATLPGRYTKDAFEGRVKTEITRLVDTLGKLSVPAEVQTRLYDVVRGDVARYANLYRSEVMRFLEAYQLNVSSPEALRVALGQISAEKSPFEDFARALAENTNLADEPAEPKSDAAKPADKKPASSADAAQRLLEPVYAAVSDFGAWNAAVGGDKGSPEISKYKEIVKQLLTDLSSAAQAGQKSGKGGDEPSELEKQLSPVGRTALSILRTEKGSYLQMVEDWVASADLTIAQRAPFLAPFNALSGMGEGEIENLVATAWSRDMRPALNDIASKFPFNRSATEYATPDEVSALFHPIEGKFFIAFRGYIEPLTDPDRTKTLHELAAFQRSIRLPADLYPLANAATVLSERLWDEKGVARKVELSVTPVPFDRARATQRVPTMVSLSAGKESVFNFNQAPAPTTLSIDWTRDEPVEFNVQLTDVDTNENSYLVPLSAEGPFWRFFRLLARAEVSKVKAPVEAELYEWDLPLADGASALRTQLRIQGDPWRGFAQLRAASAIKRAR